MRLGRRCSFGVYKTSNQMHCIVVSSTMFGILCSQVFYSASGSHELQTIARYGAPIANTRPSGTLSCGHKLVRNFCMSMSIRVPADPKCFRRRLSTKYNIGNDSRNLHCQIANCSIYYLYMFIQHNIQQNQHSLTDNIPQHQPFNL